MEQKKLILVAISVGIFLVITIGAAILVFGADNTSPAVITARPIPAGSSLTHELIPVSVSTVTSELPLSGENSTLILNNPDANDNSAIAAKPDESRNENAGLVIITPKDEDSSTIINVARPSTAAVPDVQPVNRQAAPAQSSTRTPAPAPAAPAAAPRPAATPASATPRPAPANSAAIAAASRTQDDFWVQTGSFSTVARAEGMKENLASKGITSIIENRVMDGTTYYRVRVGPYTSKNEADYWLTLIKSMAGFETSQVWQSQSLR